MFGKGKPKLCNLLSTKPASKAFLSHCNLGTGFKSVSNWYRLLCGRLLMHWSRSHLALKPSYHHWPKYRLSWETLFMSHIVWPMVSLSLDMVAIIHSTLSQTQNDLDTQRFMWAKHALIILSMGSTNERRRYHVTTSLIGWAHAQSNTWTWLCDMGVLKVH